MSGVRNLLLVSSCIALVCGISADASPKPAKNTAAPAAVAAGPQPATDKERAAYTGKPVMDPSIVSGMAAMGYAAAKAAPEVMSKLFCYCGCDETDKHSALIDCFTGTHGVDCHICQEEAVLGLKMFRDGASIPEIQKRVDSTYSSMYPFTEKTEALKKYETTHLGVIGSTPTQIPTSTSPSGTPDCPTADAKVKDGKATLKPGMSAGNCCGEGAKHKSKKK
jgi:hypothetical protein